jgi:hypothetical protein
MSAPKIYNYHPVTLECLGEGVADFNPLEPSNWLVPAHATIKRPPAVKHRECAVFQFEEWRVLPDYRGAELWSVTGEKIKIDTLGIMPPTDSMDRPPIAPVLSSIESERMWRDSELLELTWLRERHRDQLDIDTPTTLSDELFKDLLRYVQSLRDWPQAPEFPDSQYRPVAPSWIAEHIE